MGLLRVALRIEFERIIFFIAMGQQRPIHVKASHPAFRGGALCRDLTSSRILIQNLISVHRSKRAVQLSEISLVYWRDLGKRDENVLIWE